MQVSHTHFRSCTQKPKCSNAMAGMPPAAVAAEHEDRDKVVAAQFKEQQQRPLKRSREAKSREAGLTYRIG